VTDWFIKLKKWQKGGLIGLVIGFVIVFFMVVVIIIDPEHRGFSELEDLHGFIFLISGWIGDFNRILDIPVGSLLTIVCYSCFGAIVGRVQQLASTLWRWLLTSILVILLLFIYWFNLQVAGWLSNA